MKKLLVTLLTFVMVMAFSACGAKEETPLPPIEPNEETSSVTTEEPEKIEEPEDLSPAPPAEIVVPPFATIEAKDRFYDAGYVEFIAGAEKTANYTFTAENSEGVTWRVYVFDEAFEDGYRYITQAAEPALEGDGTISVTEGQFVYVYCSVNEFTADAANETAKLNVTVE